MVEYRSPQSGYEGLLMDSAKIRYDLYRLLASIYASERFPHEAIDYENPLSLGNLAGQFEDSEISHLLITVAIEVRTALQRYPEPGKLQCGELTQAGATQPLTVREACNKVIHAKEVRGDVDWEAGRIVKFNPVMHLHGTTPQGAPWTARLDLAVFASHLMRLF